MKKLSNLILTMLALLTGAAVSLTQEVVRTPHGNPAATPYPDEVLVNQISWWWPAIAVAAVLVLAIWKGPAAYRLFFKTSTKNVSYGTRPTPPPARFKDNP